jgi:nicotinamide-nucleotide amidase
MSEPIKTHPRAAILTIGTEITTGQILNSNAQWLGEQLTNIGFEVVIHEVVPDEWGLISSGLDRCAALADVLIVGGGLGPTSDDFTRDVVGEWLGVPMSYHESSWDWLSERIGRLGVEVAESNRRQCFYPDGARVIRNTAGTANAFWCEGQGKKLVCLPGPPREVRAVWNEIENNYLRKQFSLPEPERLIRWQCLGKSEASLGEIVERVVAGKLVRTGYRPHVPFVEIKVWFQNNQSHDDLISAMDEALKPWCVGKDDADAWREVLELLECATKHVRVLDLSGTGELTNRLLSLRGKSDISFAKFSTSFAIEGDCHDQADGTVDIVIGEIVGDVWRASLAADGNILAEVEIPFPYKYDDGQRERFAKFRVEMSGFRLLEAMRRKGRDA